jgi:hypothetical protein
MRVWWLVLAGCNSILGLEPTTEVVFDAPAETMPLLFPPSGPTTCGAPIAFDAWLPEGMPMDGGVFGGLTLYRDQSGNRAMFSRVADSKWRIFDWDLDPSHPPSEVIVPPPASVFGGVGLDPTSNVLWYQQGSDVMWATRASGWTVKGHAEFGFAPSVVTPGNVGFYNGTARMVVTVQDTVAALPRLVELSTMDGLQWDATDAIAFDVPVSRYPIAPSLSYDGCFLLFVANDSLYVAFRDGEGRFAGPLVMVPAQTGEGRHLGAVTSDLEELWTIDGPLGVDTFHFTVSRP